MSKSPPQQSEQREDNFLTGLGKGRAWTENVEIFVLSKLLKLPVCPFWPLLAWGKGILIFGAGSKRGSCLISISRRIYLRRPDCPLLCGECQHSSASLTPHCWAGYSIPRDSFQSTTSLRLCCVLLLVPVESSPAQMETEMAESQLLTRPCLVFFLHPNVAGSFRSVLIIQMILD